MSYSTLKIYGLVIVLLLFMLLPTQLSAEVEQNRVRVGIMSPSEFYHVDENGNLSGYGYDYLQELAKYAGWNYQYVKGSWQENLELLKRGEIDLLGLTVYDEDLAHDFLYSPQPSNIITVALYTRINNITLQYEDYPAFNNLNVGLIENSAYNNAFHDFCTLHNLSTKNLYYQTIPDLLHALAAGDIDAIVSVDAVNASNIKVVAPLSRQPYYFITGKDNTELLNKLQHAQNQINVNQPYYEALLHEKYFKMPTAAFTNEEIKYINSRKNMPLTVVYNPDWAPIEYYNTSTEKAEGLSIDIFEHLAAYSGLQFKFVKPSSFSNALNMIENNEVDLISAIDYDVNSPNQTLQLSNTYLSIPSTIIKNKHHSPRQHPIIALPKNLVSTVKYHHTIGKDSSIIYFDTVEDCFDAVASGDADITYTNSYITDSLLHSYKYNNLTSALVQHYDDKLYIALAPNADPLLLSILNKSILSLPQKKLDAMILDNTLKQVPETHLISLFYRYIKEISIIAIVSCLLCILILAYIINIKSRYNKKIEQIAFIDQLTGMWNFNKFKIEAERILKNSPSNQYAILFIDVTKFKYINNSFGFNVGDKALQHIATILAENIMAGNIFSRFSADQFILMMRYQQKKEIITEINNLFCKLQTFKRTDTEFYTLNFSCGISLFDNNTMKFSDIYIVIDQAIMAQRTLKGDSGSSYVFYNDAYREQIIKEKNIEDIMESALDKQEFVVFYQPKHLLSTGEISGAEALVRWKNPNYGMIFPDDFIPLFEKNGFITKLDFYVIKRVCKEMSAWLSQGKKPLPVSINVSRIHINNPFFAEQLQIIVDQYHLPHHLIELEITESAFIENAEKLQDFILKLKALNFIVSMDDFGSGYSSLNLLKKLPFDILKIDKDFLQTGYSTEREQIIISSIVEMSQKLNIRVVAEGVETIEQAEFLKKIKCDIAQGYLFSRPIELQKFLEKF